MTNTTASLKEIVPLKPLVVSFLSMLPDHWADVARGTTLLHQYFETIHADKRKGGIKFNPNDHHPWTFASNLIDAVQSVDEVTPAVYPWLSIAEEHPQHVCAPLRTPFRHTACLLTVHKPRVAAGGVIEYEIGQVLAPYLSTADIVAQAAEAGERGATSLDFLPMQRRRYNKLTRQLDHWGPFLERHYKKAVPPDWSLVPEV